MKKEIMKKEIILNLKLLLVCSLLTLLFYLIYYPLYNPDKHGDSSGMVYDEDRMKENVQMSPIDTSYAELDTGNFVESYSKSQRDCGTVQKVGVGGLKGVNSNPDLYRGNFVQEWKKSFREADPRQEVGVVGLNASSYDAQISSATQLDNLNETRMELFKEDIQSKVIYCFIISCSILILGIYIYLFMNWLKQDSE